MELTSGGVGMATRSDGESIARERIAREAQERTGFLDLGMLGLTVPPQELFDLKHLQSLNLGSGWRESSGEWRRADASLGLNDIAATMRSLAALPDLRELWLAETELDTLSCLGEARKIRSIDCSGTQVSDLSPLAGLPALQSVDCSGTQVSDLSPLAQIASLSEITCNGMTLAASAIRYLNGRSLARFVCYQTRIRGVPSEVLSEHEYRDCLQRVRAHLLDLEAGGVESRDVKLMVLGNGRVGKTQLCRRLRGLPYDESLPSTHGIVVESFDFPQGAQLDFAKVHIWDFGGQDIYHGTHALFLRANAIFILVWVPEFEAGEQELGGITFRNYPLRYWVDYVRQLGGSESAVLVVQTRCDKPRDRRVAPIDDAALQDAFGSGYSEVLQFSARNDRGLPALKEKLGEAIAFLRESQGVARIGASRQRVKERLEKLRDEDTDRDPERRRHRWLTQDAFRKICEKEQLVSEPRFLLDYLHNVGVVFYREGLFEDRIVLDQGWALEAIYAVFNREMSLRQLRLLRGRFTRPLLEALVWRDRPIGEQELLIGMMLSCGICFTVREADAKARIEAEYIVPDLLPERHDVQTELDALWGRAAPDEQEAYAYDLLLPSLVRSLISRIGDQAGVSALYWRDGLCVYESSTGAYALIEQELGDGWSGRLVISTRGGRARELLERLQLWIEQEQDRIGLRRREGPEIRAPERGRRGYVGEDEESIPKMRFATEPGAKDRWYVSYAWNDPTDPQREKDVDRTLRSRCGKRHADHPRQDGDEFWRCHIEVHEGHRQG